MSSFRRSNGREVTGTIDLVQGNTLRLKLDGVVKGGKATHLQVRSSSPLIAITQRPDEKQREQTITLNVSDTGTARLVTISAHSPGSNSVGASFRINVLPKLVLPDFGSEVGIVTHLLLAESLTPSYRVAYGNGEDVFLAMELMREVLDNRLTATRTSEDFRSYVACNPVSDNLKGIVQANLCGRATLAQFKGFDGTRNAPDAQQARIINSVLIQANDGSHAYFEQARKHIETAIEIASRPSKMAPISDSSLIFWRTTDSGAPSNYATQKKILAGQVFYSLSKNYLNNPQNPARN